MKKIVSVLLLGTLLIAGCSSSDKKSSTSTTSPNKNQGKVEFTKCGALKCATIKVPMNYKKPKGRKINIAMAKMSAADPSKRIGVLLINPGGPGASGIDLVTNSADFIFSQDIKDRFDIIGWDPRGVGKSTRVQCAESLDPLFDGVDYSPDTDAEVTKLKEANAWFGKQCEKEDAELLPYLSTLDSVQDMDEIRKQLGEDKINYLGFSYGTALGQLYAHKYPKNFRTMVIDGVMDLGADPKDLAVEQTVGFDDAMSSFFNYCDKSGCEYSPGKDARGAFMSIMNQIDAKSMPSVTQPSFLLGPPQLDLGASMNLYSGEVGWGYLDSALKNVQNNNPNEMLNSFSSYVGRESSGKYDGSYSSFLTIGCADGRIGTADEMVDLAQSVKSQAPIFGQSGILLGLPCATWPNAQAAKSYDVDATGSAPIVVIGTTGDPATPVQWARNAAKQLKTGVYVEYVGEGHTAYGQGVDCIDSLVDNYLLTAKEPSSKVCR